MKRKAYTGFAVFVSIILLSIFVTPGGAAEEPIRLKWSTFILSSEIPTICQNYWCDLVEKKTAGRVKFDRFVGAVLGGAKEHLNLARTGSVDLATIIPLYHPAEMPLHSFPNMPVWRTGDDACAGVLALGFDIQETAAFFEKEARKVNIKLLMWHSLGDYGIMSRLRARSLADLKGKKIAIFGGDYGARLEKELGMVPVTALTTDYYEVISKGVVDGVLSTPAALVALKTYEPAKAFINLGLSATGAPLVINLKTWERLPTDIQKVMMSAARETLEYGKKADAEFIRNGYKLYEEHGLIVTKKLSAEEQEMLEKKWEGIMEQYWVDNMAKNGLGNEAKTVIKYWKQLKQEYRK